MKVYKTCFQVIRSRLPSLMIYLGIFLLLSLLLSSLNQNGTAMTFTASKSSVAIFNDDKGSPIADGLKAYLDKNTVPVSVRDDKRAIQDALFFRKADSIMRIPSGFSENLKNGTAKIDRTARANSTSSIYTDYLVNRYLNLANLYAKSLPNLSEEQVAARVSDALQNQTKVSMHTFGQKSSTSNIAYYFNYLAYSIIAILVLSTSSILFTFQKLDLRRRNLCAPMSSFSMNFQLLLANLTFALIVWAVMTGMGLLLYGRMLSAPAAALYLLNTFALTFVGLGIGFLASALVKSDQAANAAANIVSLGMSFLCGVFVPQEILSSGVLSAAHFLPVYWYVRADKIIDSLSSYTFSAYAPALYAMLIQFGFAIALCAVSLLIYRQKQTASD